MEGSECAPNLETVVEELSKTGRMTEKAEAVYFRAFPWTKQRYHELPVEGRNHFIRYVMLPAYRKLVEDNRRELKTTIESTVQGNMASSVGSTHEKQCKQPRLETGNESACVVSQMKSGTLVHSVDFYPPPDEGTDFASPEIPHFVCGTDIACYFSFMSRLKWRR